MLLTVPQALMEYHMLLLSLLWICLLLFFTRYALQCWLGSLPLNIPTSILLYLSAFQRNRLELIVFWELATMRRHIDAPKSGLGGSSGGGPPASRPAGPAGQTAGCPDHARSARGREQQRVLGPDREAHRRLGLA